MKLSICPFERLFPELNFGEQDLSWCCNYGSSDCPLINKNAKCEGGKDLVFSPWHLSGLDLGINHTTDYRHTQS